MRRRWKRKNHPAPRKIDKRKVARRLSPHYKRTLKAASLSRNQKSALRRYKKFWGIPFPPEIVRAPGPNIALAGMGYTTGIFLADGPEGKARRKWTIKGRRKVYTDPKGKKIIFLSKSKAGWKKLGRKPRFVGWAYKTDYRPTKAIEDAGSHKANTHWTHSHGSDEKGRWPKVYKDEGGNFIYAPGTFKVTDWIYH